MAEERGMSFSPKDMSAGGGLWGDIEGIITSSRFITSDFNGALAEKVACYELRVVDDSGEEHEQLISIGRSLQAKVKPSGDGTKLLPATEKFNLGSNFGLFVISLETAGFPVTRMEDDISVLEGGRYYFERKAPPKARNIPKAPRADGRVFEDQVLIVTRVLYLPWDAPQAAKAGAKAPGPAKARGAAAAPKGKSGGGGGGEADETREVAAKQVLQVVLSNPDGITKQQLAAEVFQGIKSRADKADIIRLISKDPDFLGSIEGVRVEDDVLYMA